MGVLTKKYSRNPKFVLLKNQKSMGLAATLNRCIDAASGQYLARQDADDMSLPTRLEETDGLLGSKQGCQRVGHVSRFVFRRKVMLGKHYISHNAAKKRLD